MHKKTARFDKCLESLPLKIQECAEKQFELLKKDPQHPSLQFKKVGKFWSARIDLFYRALAVQDGNDFIWVWAGSHGDYDRLTRN